MTLSFTSPSHVASAGSLPFGGTGAGSQSTVYVVGEYFTSSSPPPAKSEVDYLRTPLDQIRSQVNAWLSRSGSQTAVVNEDATLIVAPQAHLPQEVFASYEPVFRTVMLYRARVANLNQGDEDLPSEDQRRAALLGLANLILARMPAPSPMILEDGTIGAYWRRDKCYASIDFEVDGEHSWAATDGTRFHSGVWKIPSEHSPLIFFSKLLSGG